MYSIINILFSNFSPAWYAVIMGTGALGSLFDIFPYGGHSRVTEGFALGFFFLNFVLFCVFLALSLYCLVIYPKAWLILLQHPVYSLYLGCVPMGMATLINVALVSAHQYWGFGGMGFVYTLWAFWWLDGIISFLCTYGLIFLMATRHKQTMSTFTPLWLLPVVTLIVASSTGQLLATRILQSNTPHALLTMGISVLMLFTGLVLALMIMTVYLSRIIIEGFPDINLIISSFIPLGPCGQGAISLLITGQNFKQVMPYGYGIVLGDEMSGRIINVICLTAAMALWVLGIWWLVMGLVAIIDVLLRGGKIPFKTSFWGIVFPNAVEAFATCQLGDALDAKFFRVLGAMYAAAVLLLWIILAIPTLFRVLDKSIFEAPYLADQDLLELAGQSQRRKQERERRDNGDIT
ncbi:hypothetical protein M422DRAFT_60665 [Sphaerobolus stellatus SS14]|uniref:Malic acid transport protein n=1 Tax=Sphaerobolus stellatus (strain SS14) TaxID=990650 RepID=A0A0C9UYK2_SPHS4|nr:hypothetical protein M422DRAFT_60665 [Sphaerobolus stellatus SS14]